MATPAATAAIAVAMTTVRDIGVSHPYAQGIITSDAQAYLMPDSTLPFALDITIDRDSKTPLHTQISEPLASLILDGTLPAGTRLEDELSMAKRLEVSRPTARQALQHLVDRGLVKRRRGVGTIVSPMHVHRPMQLTSLLADLSAAGHATSTTRNRASREASSLTRSFPVRIGRSSVRARSRLTVLRWQDARRRRGLSPARLR